MLGGPGQSVADRRAALAALVGTDEATVARTLGPFDRRTTNGEDVRLFWERLDARRVGLRRGGIASFRCETVLVLRGGRVQAFDQRGNGCG